MLAVAFLFVRSITVNWDWITNGIPATKFSIQRGPSQAGPFHEVTQVPIASRQYVDKTVKPRLNPWCYVIVAIGKKKNSPPSQVTPMSCAVLK